MIKEKRSPAASHLRKYWSIELALFIVVVVYVLLNWKGNVYKREYEHIYLPTFLGMEYFSQILGQLTCGLICLTPLAVFDTEVSNAKILGLRILAIIIILFVMYYGLWKNFEDTTDEFTYKAMLTVNEQQYFLLEHRIFYFDEGSGYPYNLFYECSQFWCDLVEDELEDVTMIYEPETNAILLIGHYQDIVIFRHPVP